MLVVVKMFSAKAMFKPDVYQERCIGYRHLVMIGSLAACGSCYISEGEKVQVCMCESGE